MAKPLTDEQWIARLRDALVANAELLKKSPKDRDEITASSERIRAELRRMGQRV